MKRLMSSNLIAMWILWLGAPTPAVADRPIPQSTADTYIVGPFLDAVDGVTPETSLDVANDVNCSIYKGDATESTLTITASGGDNDMVHVGGGMYSLELTTNNTDTAGYLRLYFTPDSNEFAPLWEDFNVGPQVANVTQIEGSDATDYLEGTNLGLAADQSSVTALGGLDVSGSRVAADMEAISGEATAADNVAVSYQAAERHGRVVLASGSINSILSQTEVGIPTIEDGDDFLGCTIVIHENGPGAQDYKIIGRIIPDSEVAPTLIKFVPYNTPQFTIDTNDYVEIYAPGFGVPDRTNLDAILADTGTDGVLLADNSVTSAAIQDTAITEAKIAANAITASEIADDAITAAKLAADAVTEIQSGLSTFDAVTDPVTVGTNNDKSGYALSQAGLADFFDTDTGTTFGSAVAGSVVKEVADNATTTAQAEGDIADAVLDELLAGHTTAGSLGEVVSDIFDFLDNAPTFADAMDGHGYTTARAEKIDQLAPSLLVSTTIDTLASQTSFTLSAGPPDDGALRGALIVVTRENGSTQKAVGLVKEYDGSTKDVTLFVDPGVFTMAAGDQVDVIATGASVPLWAGAGN